MKKAKQSGFSLTQHVQTGDGTIKPYIGAKQLLYDMFNTIERKTHLGYRDSWEILIEVLGEYLGLPYCPWLYSKPEMDIEYIAVHPPMVRIEHGFEFGMHRLDQLLLKRMKLQLKQYQQMYRFRKAETMKMFKIFTADGSLKQYVENARAESSEGSDGMSGVDHLGAIFTEFELAGRANRMGQCLTPINVVDLIIQMTFDINKSAKEPITVLDPCTGTGRFLIEATRMYPHKPLILFGIELSPTMYRATLVNMAIYSVHPYSILCGDTLTIDENQHAPGQKIWSIGNQWEPPSLEPYCVHFEPMKPFSLSAYTESSVEEPQMAVLPAPTVKTGFSLSKFVKETKK